MERPRLGERGAGLVEYGLMAILIAILAFGAVQAFGTEVGGMYDDAGTAIAEAGTEPGGEEPTEEDAEEPAEEDEGGPGKGCEKASEKAKPKVCP